jgi:hypothetical protein
MWHIGMKYTDEQKNNMSKGRLASVAKLKEQEAIEKFIKAL